MYRAAKYGGLGTKQKRCQQRSLQQTIILGFCEQFNFYTLCINRIPLCLMLYEIAGFGSDCKQYFYKKASTPGAKAVKAFHSSRTHF